MLESIEKLRDRAQVTYDEAREALEETNGDLLEALIYLEKQGKIQKPADDGYYSSERQGASTPDSKRDDHFRDAKSSFKEALSKLWKLCAQIIQKGNSTSFEVLKNQEHVGSFPVTILVLVLIFAPWVTIPILIIGLFLGFHYQFVSTDN